jgi:hypothetical protein
LEKKKHGELRDSRVFLEVMTHMDMILLFAYQQMREFCSSTLHGHVWCLECLACKITISFAKPWIVTHVKFLDLHQIFSGLGHGWLC